jgi:hypothetical protein
MSDIWLTPAAPGRVSPIELDKVRALHGSVRDWIAAAADAQRNAHLRANLPYADLMFAFGFAVLGDHAAASGLVAGARAVLDGPIPTGGGPQDEQAVTAALVGNFLFKAFRYRIEQAVAGNPHAGPLSAEVLAEREEMNDAGRSGPFNPPLKLAIYVIDRFRNVSRIVEPHERVDPYADWLKFADPLRNELGALRAIRDPAAFANSVRRLLREGVQGKAPQEIQLDVLREALPLAERVGEAFAVELLTHASPALSARPGAALAPTDLARRQGELLDLAFGLARYFRRADIAAALAHDTATLVRSAPEETRFHFVNAVARPCLRTLRVLGRTNEIERFLTSLQSDLPSVAALTEQRPKYGSEREAWSAALQALAHLAGGWYDLGSAGRADAILRVARHALLDPVAVPLQPKDYTNLARAYVAALARGPDSGWAGLTELFLQMDPTRITNTWQTALYYSRFHLELVEDTVFAACDLCSASPVPATVSE